MNLNVKDYCSLKSEPIKKRNRESLFSEPFVNKNKDAKTSTPDSFLDMAYSW